MAVEGRTSSIDLKGEPGPYLARIVSHLDTTYMGGLEVEILKTTEEGNNTETTGQTAQVKYLPGFYGVTPYSANTDNEGYKFSQQSYGMWAVPPDVGNLVLVIFVEGNISMGFWIGCVPDDFMNFQIPGNPATTFNDKDKSKNLPVGEYNKKLAKHKGNDPTKFVKPVNTDAEKRLTDAGLINDNTRGVNSSSARRELPSMVFGWSTPGPYDRRPGSPKYKYGNLGSQSQVPASRLGGSSFVMDDGDANFLRKGPASTSGPEYANVESMEKGGDPTIPKNELIRLQTRTGHQILMHNSEDLIYIANARGTTWIELTSNGKIDIYAKDSVSVHTENDYNITADRDINIEAGRNINIKSGKDFKQTTLGGNWEIKVSADGKITCGGTSNITSSHHLETAGKIDMNGPAASQSTPAQTPTRSPQVEPWAGHENYSPISHTSVATDSTIAVVAPAGSAKGTTAPTVGETVKKTEEKNATDDTMKKKCVEQSGLVT